MLAQATAAAPGGPVGVDELVEVETGTVVAVDDGTERMVPAEDGRGAIEQLVTATPTIANKRRARDPRRNGDAARECPGPRLRNIDTPSAVLSDYDDLLRRGGDSQPARTAQPSERLSSYDSLGI